MANKKEFKNEDGTTSCVHYGEVVGKNAKGFDKRKEEYRHTLEGTTPCGVETTEEVVNKEVTNEKKLPNYYLNQGALANATNLVKGSKLLTPAQLREWFLVCRKLLNEGDHDVN